MFVNVSVSCPYCKTQTYPVAETVQVFAQPEQKLSVIKCKNCDAALTFLSLPGPGQEAHKACTEIDKVMRKLDAMSKELRELKATVLRPGR